MNLNLTSGLIRWWRAEGRVIRSRGIHGTITRGNRNHRPRSAWIDLESDRQIVRVTVWDDGQCDIAVGEIATGEVIRQSHFDAVEPEQLPMLMGTVVADLVGS